MPVHFAGLPVDLDPLYEIANRHGLRVLKMLHMPLVPNIRVNALAALVIPKYLVFILTKI